MQLIDQRDIDLARDFLAGRREPRPLAGLFGWVMLIGLAYLLAYKTWFHFAPQPLKLTAAIAIAAGYVLFVLFWFVVLRRLRGPIRGYTFLEPPHFFEWELGIGIQREGSELRWAWTVFNAARESPHHFLLRSMYGEWVIVPKHAISTPQALQRLREELQSRFPGFVSVVAP